MANKTQGIYPGMILGFNSDSVPSTYNLCDGNNGTRNLKGRLPRCIDSGHTLGAIGGDNTHYHGWYGGGGGGSLVYAFPTGNFQNEAPAGKYVPGGSEMLSAGNFDPVSNIPSYCAVNFIQAKYVGGVPQGSIVWWSGTAGSVPSDWTIYTALYNRFAIGALSGTYNLGSTGGGTTHVHIGNCYGTFTLSPGNVIKAGTGFANTGTFGGTIGTPSLSIIPLFYGLIPIISLGVRGLYTGMVLPYDGDLDDLPSAFDVYDTADERFIMGAGSTYNVNSTGGSSSYSHNHGGSASYSGGAGSLASGTAVKAAASAHWLNVITSIGSSGSVSNGSWFPPYMDLYYIKVL